jgi:uncharacterized protein (UPF0548 family)
VPRRPPAIRRLGTAARWPAGIALTSWRYMWRTVPVHRWEMTGSMPDDGPPLVPPEVEHGELLLPDRGVGPLLHRMYRTRIRAPRVSPTELMRTIQSDVDRIAPTDLASFQKVHGEEGTLRVDDEYVVRMPGPWDGPVRVVAVTPDSFRLATLEGHLEAGQIEFRVTPAGLALEFSIESWARSGDRLSDLLYTHVRMAKEIQLHMWTSVLERVVRLSGGAREGGIVVTTRRVDLRERDGGTAPDPRLDALSGASVNFDPDTVAPGSEGWHFDDLTEALPSEPSGDPVEGGSWRVARQLMLDYQVADPDRLRATYQRDAPLAGRDMLLRIPFAGFRIRVGVRVGDVYDETRVVDGREARVFGWDYRTLEGHFEQGQMHYEVWKWLDTGEVEFRLHAFSRAARSGPLLLRLGFRLVGRRRQLDFYRQACRRMRRLTESQLETERLARR